MGVPGSNPTPVRFEKRVSALLEDRQDRNVRVMLYATLAVSYLRLTVGGERTDNRLDGASKVINTPLVTSFLPCLLT